MDLKEKRKRLRQRFPNKPHTTLHNWCKKFDSETQNPVPLIRGIEGLSRFRQLPTATFLTPDED